MAMDFRIEFDQEKEGVYFQVVDPDTGEKVYIRLKTLWGVKANKEPEEGEYILEERLVEGSPSVEIVPDGETWAKVEPFWSVEDFKKEWEKKKDIIDWEDNWLM